MLHNVNVFGENLKHVIQIPRKDFEEKRWLELMYMRLPAPLHSCTCWTGHRTQKIRATCLSTGRKVTTDLPWTEQFSPSERQRGSLSKWDWQNSNYHRTQNYKPYRKANRCSTEISAYGWECLGRQGSEEGPMNKLWRNTLLKELWKKFCIK